MTLNGIVAVISYILLLIQCYLHGRPRTGALTISEVAVDWQEPMVLQRKCGDPLPVLTDTGAAVAASKHTTAPINHTRPSHAPKIAI